MKIRNGTCIDCGNAKHECECAEREQAAAESKVDEFLSHFVGDAQLGPFLCFGCYQSTVEYYVHDDVWAAAWPHYQRDQTLIRNRHRKMEPQQYGEGSRHLKVRRPHALLCFDCLRRGLGRQLLLTDFTTGRINAGIRFGYFLGKGAVLTGLMAASGGGG